MVRLKKGLASRYWEQVTMAIIGEQYDVGNEICGAVLSIRFQEDIISIWNRNADNHEATMKIRDLTRSMLKLPNFVQMEYKRHDASITDNSSFRNATTWRSSPRSRTNERPNLRSPPRSPSGPHAFSPRSRTESWDRSDAHGSPRSQSNSRDANWRSSKESITNWRSPR